MNKPIENPPSKDRPSNMASGAYILVAIAALAVATSVAVRKCVADKPEQETSDQPKLEKPASGEQEKPTEKTGKTVTLRDAPIITLNGIDLEQTLDPESVSTIYESIRDKCENKLSEPLLDKTVIEEGEGFTMSLKIVLAPSADEMETCSDREARKAGYDWEKIKTLRKVNKAKQLVQWRDHILQLSAETPADDVLVATFEYEMIMDKMLFENMMDGQNVLEVLGIDDKEDFEYKYIYDVSEFLQNLYANNEDIVSDAIYLETRWENAQFLKQEEESIGLY
ncbi:hypothetical protein HZC21_03240 [Candidatus Peregrinibacteria bacterium]|nr:hypothetical protein [Candidatus Peregrinibacteria bacterium]